MTASRKASEVMSEPIDKRQPQRLPIVLNIKVIGEMFCNSPLTNLAGAESMHASVVWIEA
jgi:hypothetical protein